MMCLYGRKNIRFPPTMYMKELLPPILCVASCYFCFSNMHQSPHTGISITDFLVLFNDTRDRLYGLFLKQTRDKHATEDLLQDCYLRAWEKRESITMDKGGKYITGIAYNLLADWHRIQIKKKLVYMEELPDAPPDTATPGEVYSWKETQQTIQKTLAGLSTGKQVSFMLIKEEENSYKQVSALLKTPVSTLEKQIASSLAAIKKALKTCILSFLW